MKKILFAITAALVIFAGCKKTNISELAQEVGTVNFSLASDSNPEYVTKSTVSAVDASEFQVSITGDNYSNTWNKYSEMDKVMELVSGTYTVTASYPANPEAVAFDQPVFGGSKEFSVQVGAVSNVSLECSVQNMMVTINASDTFKNELSTYQITVSSKDGYLTWGKTEVEAGKAGFFNVSDLEVIVRGTRHNGDVAPDQYLKITGCAAKEHHIINLGAEVTGSAGITITVDNEVSDKNVDIMVPGLEEIPVDSGDTESGSDGSTTEDEETKEETTTPSTAPTMTWASNPDFAQLTITSSMDVVINIQAQEMIEDFVVKVESDSEDFLLEVGKLVSPSNYFSTATPPYVILDLIDDATAVDNMTGILKCGNDLYGQTSVDFELSTLIPMISSMSASQDEHVFTLTVTDKKGQQLSKPVSFITE